MLEREVVFLCSRFLLPHFKTLRSKREEGRKKGEQVAGSWGVCAPSQFLDHFPVKRLDMGFLGIPSEASSGGEGSRAHPSPWEL